MNYTANIQNFLKKNEIHCIFLSKIHKICSALQFLFLLEGGASRINIHIR